MCVPALSTPSSPESSGTADSPHTGWSCCPLPGGQGQAQRCSCPSGASLALLARPRDGGFSVSINGDQGSLGTSWSGLASWKGKGKRKGKGCAGGGGQGSAVPVLCHIGIWQQHQALKGEGNHGFVVHFSGKSPVLEAACGYYNSFNTIKNQ